VSAACSATALTAWLAAAKYESATVVQTVTSQASGLPPRQGMRLQPSGRLLSCEPAPSLPYYYIIIIIVHRGSIPMVENKE